MKKTQPWNQVKLAGNLATEPKIQEYKTKTGEVKEMAFITIAILNINKEAKPTYATMSAFGKQVDAVKEMKTGQAFAYTGKLSQRTEVVNGKNHNTMTIIVSKIAELEYLKDATKDKKSPQR